MAHKERSKNFRMIQGRVVSDKMDKTRVVLVETLRRHPLFHKAMRHSRRIKIHDERNEAHEGDLVLAIETRPLSRHKRHRLHKILERAK
ncbi:MAG: 30S ribosomal protein S17 [Leptospiraceae bacterium]|nr:30S ribosomal protein S17 [Leptospiraceae bacterium]MCB1316353.1 30S ribosomal protein S17 [Leptospiraceae bacterium]MCB1322572.1 30S ribosomal protein S17 [Leptospiraceae bacterium]